MSANPNDLVELYRHAVLEHSRTPSHRGVLTEPTHESTGFNALCGDKVSVQLVIEDETITDVAFEGASCAICTASASMMTDAVLNGSANEADASVDTINEMLAGTETRLTEKFSPLNALQGVSAYPSRVKCATLPWRTLRAALRQETETVTTEGQKSDHVRT